MTFGTLAAVAAGGAIGATLRYLIHTGLTLWHGAESAWSTLAVNVVGSFCLGLAAALISHRVDHLPPFFMIGLLGAFTTFSTFALDATSLAEGRSMSIAALYIGLSVSLAIFAFVGGDLVGARLK